MSLHGDISVNGSRIGWWRARRATTSPDGLYVYEWEASADHGTLGGVLTHRYTAGAAALAAAVLLAYGRHASCPDCEWCECTTMSDPLPRYALVAACADHRRGVRW